MTLLRLRPFVGHPAGTGIATAVTENHVNDNADVGDGDIEVVVGIGTEQIELRIRQREDIVDNNDNV